MAITTATLTATREDVAKDGWKVTAPNLLAANYPNLSSTKVGKGKTEKQVAQVVLRPENVTFRKFGSIEDVRSEAGARFDSWVVEAANQISETRADKGARAFIRGLNVYGGETITFDGTTIDIFAPEEVSKGGPKSGAKQAASLIAEVAQLEGMSDGDVVKLLMARLAAMAGQAV